MAADPLVGLGAAPVEHDSALAIDVANAQAVDNALLEEHGGLAAAASQLAPPGNSTENFWLNGAAEQDFDQALGDVLQTRVSPHDQTGLSHARSEYGFIGTGQ